MITVEGRMYRATFDNIWLEDISPYFIQAKVDMDTSRDQTWQLSATLTWAGWQALNVYEDWLAPYLKVTYPDGTVREGQLGLYMVLDSPEEHAEYSARVTLEAADPLWLIARQGFTGNLVARGGANKIRVVREILESAVLTESTGGRRRYAIPNHDNENFKRSREWDKDDNRLVVCNDILEGAGYYPLWSTKTGILTSMRAGERRLKNQTPIRAFTAHPPSTLLLPSNEEPLGGMPADITGRVRTKPLNDDLYNEILIVNDSPHKANKVRVRGRITNGNNPRAVMRKHGRRRTKRIRNPVLEDDATALEVANAIKDKISTYNSVIEVKAHPDPQPEWSRSVVACHLYNGQGIEIAEGKYIVHRIDFGFTPSTATMNATLGRIDEALDIGNLV